jgi:hypothetical protein
MKRRHFIKQTVLSSLLLPLYDVQIVRGNTQPSVFFLHSSLSLPPVPASHTLTVLLDIDLSAQFLDSFENVNRIYSDDDMLPRFGIKVDPEYSGSYVQSGNILFSDMDDVALLNPELTEFASVFLPVACEIPAYMQIPEALLNPAVVLLPDESGVVRKLLIYGMKLTDLPTGGILSSFLQSESV